MARPKWDLYFIRIAKEIASRSTCPRAAVGVVIVKDNRILATGYNGAPPDEPHCTDVGCLMVDGHCQRAIHAETNAIAQAAKHGISVDGATLYMYDTKGRYSQSIDGWDCHYCGQLMKAAGIAKAYSRGL